MDSEILTRSFEKMGARVQIVPVGGPANSPRLLAWGNSAPANGFSVDVRKDKRGEFFEIRKRDGIDFKTVEVLPDDRHLLLLAENEDGVKSKFLCGHDERQWFVAAVPGSGVKDVNSAKESLKPLSVVSRQRESTEAVKGRRSRRNKVYKRQGEWFFTPMHASFNPKSVLVLKNEPIRRGGGKPHMCENLYRTGGETVYVSRIAVNGLTEAEYKDHLHRFPEDDKMRWTPMRRNAGVFVKGRITHPDHATLVLDGWHSVLPNREGDAPHGKNVAFLD